MENGTRIPKKAAGLLERDLGDALIVMAETGDATHTLKGTARFLWRSMDGSATVGALLDRLTAEYDVTAAKAEGDLEAFLRQLEEKGLISY